MKSLKEETACNCQNTQAKTGFLTQNKLTNLLHFHNAANTGSRASSSKAAYREEEARLIEAEAELKKAQARAYASATPLR